MAAAPHAVLVDDHRAHAFVEVRSREQVLDDPVLERQRLLDRVRHPSLGLRDPEPVEEEGEAGPLLLVLERLDAPEELLDLVRSRLHLRAGALDRAIALATRALEGSADPSGPSRRAAHLRENLRWIATVAGDPDLLQVVRAR